MVIDKKSSLVASLANSKRKLWCKQNCTIAHNLYIMQWSTAYTVACRNGTDSDQVMDNGMVWAWMTSQSMCAYEILVNQVEG